MHMNFKTENAGFQPGRATHGIFTRFLDASTTARAPLSHSRKIFAAAQPFSISTIVGSGVALCLWDSEHRIGVPIHFILPEGPEDSVNATRYAQRGQRALLKRMLDLGAQRISLEARISAVRCLRDISSGGDCLGSATFTSHHFIKMNNIRWCERSRW